MKPVTNSLILITLLVELGVAAAVSSSLARSKTFRDLLLLTHRTFPTDDEAGGADLLDAGDAWACGFGCGCRTFMLADISFETTILMGFCWARWPAMGGRRAALSLPAMWHGEYWTLPVNLVIGGDRRGVRPIRGCEDVWSFSPLIDLSIYRWVSRNLQRPHLDRQILLLVLITAMEVRPRAMLGHAWHARRFYALYSDL